MEMNIRESLLMIVPVDMGYTGIQTGLHMKAIGLMIVRMELVRRNGVIILNMRVIT
jgi:hypothetical protein